MPSLTDHQADFVLQYRRRHCPFHVNDVVPSGTRDDNGQVIIFIGQCRISRIVSDVASGLGGPDNHLIYLEHILPPAVRAALSSW